MFCGVWVPADPCLLTRFSLGIYKRIVQAGAQRTDHPFVYMAALFILQRLI